MGTSKSRILVEMQTMMWAQMGIGQKVTQVAFGKEIIYILYISWIIGEHLLVMGSQRDTHLKAAD